MTAVDTRTVTVELEVVSCGQCGGVYALTQRYLREMHQIGGTWHCPYCEVGWGYVQSENARLRKELEREKKHTEWARQDARIAKGERDKALRKERGQRAAKTRIKKLVSGGACPCCHRFFPKLRDHMRVKHPNYSKGQE